MTTHPGSTLELTIEKPVAGGRMLARNAGQVVLVAGAIPGERVRVRIERAAKRLLFADTVDVLDPSPFRRVPASDPACGGLLLSHVQYEHQLDLKAEILRETFSRVGKLTLSARPVVTSSPEQAYRMRARLHAVRGHVGFFREGSRAICDAGPTRQLSPEALPAVLRLMASLGAASGLIEAVTIVEDIPGDRRVALLEVATGERLRVPAGGGAAVEGLDGICLRTRDRVVTLQGQSSVVDVGGALGLPGTEGREIRWTRSVASFFQGNRFIVGALLRSVLGHVRGDRLADLYAGVGLFAVPLAARGARVVAIEGDPWSGADLQTNALAWPTLEPRVTSVEEGLSDGAMSGLDCLVLDPPRTGVSPLALDRLRRLQAARVVYVSCEPATLARDAAALVSSGYELTALEAFDMFPNTPHIEALAVFDATHR